LPSAGPAVAGGFAVAQGLTPPTGGLLSASTPDQALVDALTQDASSYTWVAAVVGANEAAGYQLATDSAVMALGGFNGSDPSPTLAQFQQDVAAGRVHWFVAGGGGGVGGPTAAGAATSSTTTQITSWVAQNFTAQTVGEVTVYDLSSSSATGSTT